jgi:hypothetical protein
MRVLFTVLPGTGSLRPLLPVAHALRAQGHEVALCSSPALGPAVEQYGLPFFAAGLDWDTSDPSYIDVLCAAAGGLRFPPLTGMARLAWVTNELFIGAAARCMLPDVVRIAREWPADLVVRQSFEYSGCVAAERLGLPHASVADAAHSALDGRHDVAAALDGLRSSVGLPPDPGGAMVYRHLHLCFAPPRFDGPDAVFPPTARFLRHTDPTPTEDRPPSWVVELEARPTVLVSMGTVFHRTAGIYEAVPEGSTASRNRWPAASPWSSSPSQPISPTALSAAPPSVSESPSDQKSGPRPMSAGRPGRCWPTRVSPVGQRRCSVTWPHFPVSTTQSSSSSPCTATAAAYHDRWRRGPLDDAQPRCR